MKGGVFFVPSSKLKMKEIFKFRFSERQAARRKKEMQPPPLKKMCVLFKLKRTAFKL